MDDNIVKKIEIIMKENKEKIAVEYNGTHYTYGELDRFTYKIAMFLQNRKITAEDIVAVYMERSWLSVCTTIGILRAGAAFLPIDKKVPTNRIEKILEIANAKVLFCDTVPDISEMIDINLVDINHIIAEEDFSGMLKEAEINDYTLAYVIFTSGTTGEPKGVMIEHGGLSNHIAEKVRLLELDSQSIVAHNASIGFDISVWQILAPLSCGGQVVIFSEKSILHISRFLKIIEKEMVTVLEVVPTYLNVIISECEKRTVHNNLSYVISTGEELSKAIVERWFSVMPDIPLVNAYGPTEASDDIAHYIISKSDVFEHIPIGMPIRNAKFVIMLDEELSEQGELWVSGICVGRGYIGNIEETQKYFSIDKITGERIYKTGDIVSKSEDGKYYYHGRIDSQIKLRGNRIEIREVESSIMDFEQIREAAVIYNQEKEELYAVFTAANVIDIERLQMYLKKKIPYYMIPSFFKQIPEIPVDINGKTDIRIIRKMISDRKDNISIYNEKKVCELIKEIMKLDALPKDENWKNDLTIIGLESLSTIQLIVSIEETFGFEFDEKYLCPEVIFNFHEICKCILAYTTKSEES